MCVILSRHLLTSNEDLSLEGSKRACRLGLFWRKDDEKAGMEVGAKHADLDCWHYAQVTH